VLLRQVEVHGGGDASRCVAILPAGLNVPSSPADTVVVVTAAPLATETSPEALAERIADTVRLRQELRAASAPRELLELNRLELLGLHRRLAESLIARHLRPAAA
jgi:hypothetical protein